MKRHLPLITLLVVSFFVFLCALGVVYVLSVDAVTAEEKLQSMLTLGIPSALALLVLLWFGAGMDWVLSRLKQRSTRITVSLLTYIFVPIVLCIGLPALIGLGIYSFMAKPTGWTELPAPPEPAVEMSKVDWTSVIIRTDAGDYYVCGVTTPSACWQPTGEPEESIIEDAIDEPPNFTPPENTISLKGVRHQDMGNEEQTYFALQQDGSVWVLEQNHNTYEAGFATGLFLTIALIPAIAGLLVIYLGAGMSALARRLATSEQM